MLRDFGPLEESLAAVAALRARYGDRLAKLVPPGPRLVWDAPIRSGPGQRPVAGRAPRRGYADLDASEAAAWATEVCSAWVRLITEDPPHDLVPSSR